MGIGGGRGGVVTRVVVTTPVPRPSALASSSRVVTALPPLWLQSLSWVASLSMLMTPLLLLTPVM